MRGYYTPVLKVKIAPGSCFPIGNTSQSNLISISSRKIKGKKIEYTDIKNNYNNNNNKMKRSEEGKEIGGKERGKEGERRI